MHKEITPGVFPSSIVRRLSTGNTAMSDSKKVENTISRMCVPQQLNDYAKQFL